MIHKMKNRRTAILSRREQEVESRKVALRTDGSPLSPADTNGVPNKPVRSIEVSQSPPVGFTAVNLRHAGAGRLTLDRKQVVVVKVSETSQWNYLQLPTHKMPPSSTASP